MIRIVRLRSGAERYPSLFSDALRLFLVLAALAFVVLFLVFPLAAVFSQALAKGWRVYIEGIRSPDVFAALKLTLFTAAIAVPLNMLFGIAASWAITRFDFRGRKFLVSLIDIPLAVSPVVAGLMYVEVFGLHGWFGSWLSEHRLHIIFAVPGIVLATVFVTFPFVARELIPFMQAQGSDEEEAAVVLGAGAWSMFWKSLFRISNGLCSTEPSLLPHARLESSALSPCSPATSVAALSLSLSKWKCSTTNTTSRQRSPQHLYSPLRPSSHS